MSGKSVPSKIVRGDPLDAFTVKPGACIFEDDGPSFPHINKTGTMLNSQVSALARQSDQDRKVMECHCCAKMISRFSDTTESSIMYKNPKVYAMTCCLSPCSTRCPVCTVDVCTEDLLEPPRIFPVSFSDRCILPEIRVEGSMIPPAALAAAEFSPREGVSEDFSSCSI